MCTIEPYCTVYNKHFSHVLFQHNGIVRTDGREAQQVLGTFGHRLVNGEFKKNTVVSLCLMCPLSL